MTGGDGGVVTGGTGCVGGVGGGTVAGGMVAGGVGNTGGSTTGGIVATGGGASVEAAGFFDFPPEPTGRGGAVSIAGIAVIGTVGVVAAGVASAAGPVNVGGGAAGLTDDDELASELERDKTLIPTAASAPTTTRPTSVSGTTHDDDREDFCAKAPGTAGTIGPTATGPIAAGDVETNGAMGVGACMDPKTAGETNASSVLGPMRSGPAATKASVTVFFPGASAPTMALPSAKRSAERRANARRIT